VMEAIFGIYLFRHGGRHKCVAENVMRVAQKHASRTFYGQVARQHTGPWGPESALSSPPTSPSGPSHTPIRAIH